MKIMPSKEVFLLLVAVAVSANALTVFRVAVGAKNATTATAKKTNQTLPLSPNKPSNASISATSNAANTTQASVVVTSARPKVSTPAKNQTQDFSSEEDSRSISREDARKLPDVNSYGSGSPNNASAASFNPKGYSGLEGSDNSTQKSTNGRNKL